jgi:hypothetical protein
MGTGVLGGRLAATFIATLFGPLFFVLVSRKRRRASAQRQLPPVTEETAP